MALLRDQMTGAFPADLVRGAMLAAPRRLTDKDSWHGHVPFAFWCVEALAPRVLVELGCHKGDSYCAFCQAVDELDLGTKCYGVDTWKGDPHAGFYGEEVFEQIRQYHDPRYGRFSTLVRSTFDEARERFEDASVDLLHVDGAHSYEDVRRDFTSWLPKLSRRSVVLFHDTEVREHGFGVYRFWEEIRREHPSFSFAHSHGLGVLAAGSSPPEPLRRLTRLGEREAEEVRRLFSRLGDAVRLQGALQVQARQRVRIARREAAVHELEGTAGRLLASVQTLEAALRRATAPLMHRERLIQQRDRVIQQRDQVIGFLSRERDAIYSSTSWKVTAPLRRAGRLVRRLRGLPDVEVTAPPVPDEAVSEAAPVPPVVPEPTPVPEPPSPSTTPAAPEPTLPVFVRSLLGDPASTLTFPRTEHPDVSIVLVTFNKVEHTYACLESVLAHGGEVPYELIVVDNASHDRTSELLSRLRNVTVVRNDANLGFGRACNQAAERARGAYLLLLNNDAELAAGCLSALLETARGDPRCGAVGGRLVLPDGRLQEAGNILWRDGTAESYGRGAEDPFAPEFSYRREVDFCSGALLLVRRDLFEKLGGFDDRYAPAYYEDVDLCMGLRDLGYRVLYEPGATARHVEHGSSSVELATRLTERNHSRFVEKWGEVLGSQLAASPANRPRGRERVSRPRVLVVDDRIPTSDVGSGYPRSHALLRLFREHDYPVTLFPSYDPTPHQPWLRNLQRDGVEVISDGRSFGEFAAARPGLYDVVFVSRPHNFSTVRRDLERSFPNAVVVYDAEALYFVREQLASQVSEGRSPENREPALRQQQELDLLRFAHLVVAVSDRERRLLEHAAPDLKGQVAVWGHPVAARPTPRPFAERGDLLFLGSFFAPGSPNVDALAYFVTEVLPLVPPHLDCRLQVVGYGAREVVGHLASERVQVVGYAEDLTPHYDAARVFVVPHRYSAGIPLKLCEAMGRGVPAVVSDLTAAQLGVADGREVLVGRTSAEMAARIVELYTDEALWSRVRANALDFARRRLDPDELGRALDEIVAGALAGGVYRA
jgi:GT2 family glycosyltransferase